jgi:hypothetical protein
MSEPQASIEASGSAPAAVARHRDHRFPGRGRRVTVRLDDEELAAIERAAERAGLTPTGYVGAVAAAPVRH